MTSKPDREFHLLEEPWIPVRWTSSLSNDIGISETFRRAREIAELAEDSPANFVALHRLLLAILHRSLTLSVGQWTDRDRARWFREGLPLEAIQRYLAHWSDRFWLFHPTHPFLQVPFLASHSETQGRSKPWTKLALEAASGNAPLLFDHSRDEDPTEVGFARGARALIGFLQFTPGGLVKVLRGSDNAGPLSNTAAVLPLGENLAETLLLGLEPPSPRQIESTPSWELDPPSLREVLDPPASATGVNDRYSRRSRSVLFLRQTGERSFSRVLFGAGLALKEDPLAPDPMASYRLTAKGNAVRLSFSYGRAAWRDLPTMLPAPGGHEHHPAPILGWAGNLYEALGEWDSQARVLVAGVASDQAKILRWRMEQIRFPQTMLVDGALAFQLQNALALGETVFSRLRGILAEVGAAAMADSDHKETRSKAYDQCDSGPAAAAYFSLLERRFPGLLRAIGRSEVDAAHAGWLASVEEAAKAAWNSHVENLGRSARLLRAEARCWPKFRSLVKGLGRGSAAVSEGTSA